MNKSIYQLKRNALILFMIKICSFEFIHGSMLPEFFVDLENYYTHQSQEYKFAGSDSHF
jgi:hypothetical protein